MGFSDTLFVDEIKCLIRTEHHNIVRFLGYCHEIKIQMVLVEGKCVAAERRHMLVVEEYMSNGSLYDIIDGMFCPLKFLLE